VLAPNHPEEAAMKPTPKQLGYLRALAQRTAQTFTYPKTAEQASAEIKRLQGHKATPTADRRREQRATQRDMDTCRGDAARVRQSELAGHRSSAQWAHTSTPTRGRPPPPGAPRAPAASLPATPPRAARASWSASASTASPA